MSYPAPPPFVGFRKRVWNIGRKLAEERGRFTNQDVFHIVEHEIGRKLTPGEKRIVVGVLKKFFYEVKRERVRKEGKFMQLIYFEYP